MEFVNNRINLKTILATVIVAFFVGRINLFNGTFPAAIAFMTVMISVSTVYIYILPILIGAMYTYSIADMYCIGDLAAIILCAFFFLFFNKVRFNSAHRLGFTITATIVSNCVYYIAIHAVDIIDFTVLAKEILAVIVFYYYFKQISNVVFSRSKRFDKDGYTTSLIIVIVSLIGSLGVSELTVGIWAFFALLTVYLSDIKGGALYIACVAIFASVSGGYRDIYLLIGVSAGVIGGHIVAMYMDKSYEKQIIAIITFACVYLANTDYLYSCAFGVGIFALVPKGIIRLMIMELEKVFWPDKANCEDGSKSRLIEELKAKRKTFDDLGKLYGNLLGSKQIISYQFEGMKRVTDTLINIIENGYSLEKSKKLVAIPTGSASYSFEGVSGDSQRAFYYGDKLAMVISDGMGKGAKASAESTLVVNTLARLLDAGFDVDLAIKTINGIMLSKENSDFFATVDLALINRRTGRTKIFKMGAATTFVKHNGHVEVIKKPALPVGVKRGIKLEYQEIKLRRGDLLIMVSDGVCDCDRKDPGCNWLIERITDMGTKDPDTVAELIINKACEKYQLRERDDLTVLVAGI